MANPGALYQRKALADVAVERAQNAIYVARKLFPLKRVTQQGGVIYEKDPKLNRIRRLDTIMGAHGRPNRLRVSDPAPTTYYCIKRGLEGFVSDEERGQADVAVRTEIAETTRLTDSLALDEELEAYERVQTFSQADTVSTKWDQSSATPVTDFLDVFSTIEQGVGRSPNSAIIGPHILRAISQTTQFNNKTSVAGMTAADVKQLGYAAAFADMIQIPRSNIYIPDTWVNTAPEGEDPVLERVWEDTCVLFYAEDPNISTQNVGVTLQWVGAPNTVDGYQVEQMRDTDGRGGDKLWVRNWRDQKPLNPKALFRFDACLTAA